MKVKTITILAYVIVWGGGLLALLGFIALLWFGQYACHNYVAYWFLGPDADATARAIFCKPKS